MLKELQPALVLFILFSLLTGLAYPLAVTGFAQLVFPRQANGSLIVRDGKPVGSDLIGQPFSDARYFWGRPSATTPQPYNGLASSGSNLGPTNPAQTDGLKARVAALRLADPGTITPVPIDLATASASGLDPHISPAAAEFQAQRVARARGIAPDRVRELLGQATEPRDLGILGEARVNVLRLNLALDQETRR
jgi:potassium-transporting ATPase KdpC subunit